MRTSPMHDEGLVENLFDPDKTEVEGSGEYNQKSRICYEVSGRRTEYNRDQTQERSTALGSRKVQGDRESEEEWSPDQSCGRKAGGVL